MDKAVDKGVNTFRQGNPDSLKILSFVAILLLLIGLFNFIHINSVVIIKRGRELGMKKVFGARPAQLFIQLYAENLVLTTISLFLSWMIIEITLPIQENQLGITATVDSSFNMILTVILLLGLPLIITLYPFFNYSFRQTIRSLQESPEKQDGYPFVVSGRAVCYHLLPDHIIHLLYEATALHVAC